MDEHDCLTEEELAALLERSLSQETRRERVRHLALCVVCRRQAALLALSEEEALPPAILPPILPDPSRRQIRPRAWHHALRAVAAILVLGAIAGALLLARQPQAPRERLSGISEPAPARTKVRSGPQRRPAPNPTDRIPTPAPESPWPNPALDRLPPAPGRPEEKAPLAVPPGPPENAEPQGLPSRYLAERRVRGVGETIQLIGSSGKISTKSAETTGILSTPCWLPPSDLLQSEEGGAVYLSNGCILRLAPKSGVRLAWSQTLLCYSVDLEQGDVLFQLGVAPKVIHVSHETIGARLQDVSGDLLLSMREALLSAAPLEGSLSVRSPSGQARTLGVGEMLVLGSDTDRVESLENTSAYRDRVFPAQGRFSPEREPRATPAKDPAAGADPLPVDEAVNFLAAQGYRYRVAGRYLREGIWFPSGSLLVSTIDEFTAARNLRNLGAAHVKRGDRPWDHLGIVLSGSREKRILDTVRQAPTPHEELLRTVLGIRGEFKVRKESVLHHPCLVGEYVLDRMRMRQDVANLMEVAISEGWLDRPEKVDWESLQGTLELAITSDSPHKLIRAIDRRQVVYSLKGAPGVMFPRKYALETIYEFSDHGNPPIWIPASILNSTDHK